MFASFAITIFFLIVLLFSVIIHELAHGYTAFSLGDPTAKYAGRLTINPLKHLDLFGSIILPLVFLLFSFLPGGQPIIFGWAKPVPVNPYNFRDKRWGGLKVALSGPASNFGIAIVFGLFIRIIDITGTLGLFLPLAQLFGVIIYLNILLGIFNLVPLPPLDGSWVLFSFFPHRAQRIRIFLQQYGLLILISVLLFGGFEWLYVIINWIFSLITGISFTL